MSKSNELKEYIVSKIGGNVGDWKREHKSSKIIDDVCFVIRDFKNTKTNQEITLVNDKVYENCSVEDSIIYIEDIDWCFKIYADIDDITNLDDTLLSDIEYSIIFYEKGNDGDFDWHVGEYLHGFKLLPKCYEEVSENEFVYSGNSRHIRTFGDLKNDLAKPIMFDGKVHTNGFIFDGYITNG